MDYNWNDQNNQSGNGSDRWNRWDSNASHSSYYNQPTHRPYGRGFMTASLICGFLSITVGLIGIALPLGALGVLFALLAYRRGKRMESACKVGLVLSSIGSILGIVLLLLARFVAPYILQEQMKDEVYRKQFEYVYNSMLRDGLGMEFEEYLEYMEDLYGISFEK